MRMCAVAGFLVAAASAQGHVFVEAEAFADRGGWKLDTQFVESMGSPYLLAHGLGHPVADARTVVELPRAGRWRVLVRTYDWVARWDAPGAPGQFRVLVGGVPLAPAFGTLGSDWAWHDGGTVDVRDRRVEVALRDLTGFDGRCDALVFTQVDGYAPPAQRTRAEPKSAGRYDLVVIGGGYAGIAATLAAARLGCKVALIQNRPVLGGNGSSEVRVWAKGGIRRGRFPRLGEIVEEFMDRAQSSPGTYEEFGDQDKLALVRAEVNVDLFLEHHVEAVELDGDAIAAIAAIAAVVALEVRTGVRKRFAAPLFADCTGHGTVGALAGADHTLLEKGHLGASNMWRWEQAAAPQPFSDVPWALDLEMADFPYPRRGHAEWFWEGGFDWHPIDALEAIRDWNLRAVFGAFRAMKRRGGRADHEHARLTWVAYIAGNRESRQLLGEVVLTRDDIVTKRAFRDGCVPTTWDIDLHYPKEQYLEKYSRAPFISKAVFDKSVDREHGYPVPYRCLYSRNVRNLLMAGRCVSVTHQALGTVRVMKTGGMMGEVVGKAASVCIRHGCRPAAVATEHLDELFELLELPGGARRATPDALLVLPEGAARGVDAVAVPGLLFDDERAELTGDWQASTHEPGFIGERYLHDGDAGKGDKTARFVLRVRQAGRYRVELTWRASPSRAAQVPVRIRTRDGERVVHVDQRRAPVGEHGFQLLDTLTMAAGIPVEVIVANAGTRGHVIVDAVRLRRVVEKQPPR